MVTRDFEGTPNMVKHHTLHTLKKVQKHMVQGVYHSDAARILNLIGIQFTPPYCLGLFHGSDNLQLTGA